MSRSRNLRTVAIGGAHDDRLLPLVHGLLLCRCERLGVALQLDPVPPMLRSQRTVLPAPASRRGRRARSRLRDCTGAERAPALGSVRQPLRLLAHAQALGVEFRLCALGRPARLGRLGIDSVRRVVGADRLAHRLGVGRRQRRDDRRARQQGRPRSPSSPGCRSGRSCSASGRRGTARSCPRSSRSSTPGATNLVGPVRVHRDEAAAGRPCWRCRPSSRSWRPGSRPYCPRS